jgi:hypothetical protein
LFTRIFGEKYRPLSSFFSNRFFQHNCQFTIHNTFRLLTLYIDISAPLTASLRNVRIDNS